MHIGWLLPTILSAEAPLPVKNLGRTWADAKLPWTGDTRPWGLGAEKVTDRGSLSLGEVATLKELMVEVIGSDGSSLSLAEVRALAGSSTRADSTSLSLGEVVSILSLAVCSDSITLTLGETKQLSSFSQLADGGDLSVEEGAPLLEASSSLTDGGTLSLTETPKVFLTVWASEILSLSLQEDKLLLSVSWPREVPTPPAGWSGEGDIPSNVWVLQAESLDSGFTKMNNLEKG